MSTTELNEGHEQIDADVAERALRAGGAASAVDDGVRTFRGRTLEELLPKIREQLGPDAIVVRQRDGLMGGIGGFFQQQFVEVDARAGGSYPRIDVYDEAPDPAGDGFAALLAAAEADAEPTVEARPSAESPPAPPLPTDESVVASAPVVEEIAAPAPAPAEEPAAPAPPVRSALDLLAESVREAALASPPPPPAQQATPRRAAPTGPTTVCSAQQLTAALVAQGLTEQLAAQLVADATAHELPFTAGDLRAATARAVARRIPLPPPRRGAGMAVAFVGPAGSGKTHAVAALAASYAQTEAPVVVVALCPKDAGAELTRLLAPFGVDVHTVASASAARTKLRRAPQDALVVLDTLAVSPTDPTAIAELAGQLAGLGLDEVQLAVPATLHPDAAHVVHERLAPLRPTGIALTHADAPAAVGAVVDLACATRLPLAYTTTGGALAGAIAPADPAAIAERLLP